MQGELQIRIAKFKDLGSNPTTEQASTIFDETCQYGTLLGGRCPHSTLCSASKGLNCAEATDSGLTERVLQQPKVLGKDPESSHRTACINAHTTAGPGA